MFYPHFRPHFRIALIVLLTACTGASMSPEEQARLRQEQAAQDKEQCKRYGFTEGSTAFSQCRMEVELARQHPVYYEPAPYPYYYSGLFPYR